MNKFFTSESVTIGHPDKLCDQVSDSILDAILKQDRLARVACEVCASNKFVLVMGEITTKAKVDYESIIRKTILEIGYNGGESGFDGSKCEIILALNTQSPDIALGVDKASDVQCGAEMGAGDQGIVYGFATDECDELMPLPIMLAHKLTAKLTSLRQSGKLKYLLPDGKAQVTVEYRNNIPLQITAVVLSSQHKSDVNVEKLRSDLSELVVLKVLPKALITKDTKIYINPTGRFVVGGPVGDSGLTGRKIIVDSYGGYCTHGGGAFSGKDASKVDRSGAYMARYICKNLVKSKLCTKAELSIAYAIGMANPVAIQLNTFNTATVDEGILLNAINKIFTFKPGEIIEMLDLLKPQFYQTARNGHFGGDFGWEKTDRVNQLLKEVECIKNANNNCNN